MVNYFNFAILGGNLFSSFKCCGFKGMNFQLRPLVYQAIKPLGYCGEEGGGVRCGAPGPAGKAGRQWRSPCWGLCLSDSPEYTDIVLVIHRPYIYIYIMYLLVLAIPLIYKNYFLIRAGLSMKNFTKVSWLFNSELIMSRPIF